MLEQVPAVRKLGSVPLFLPAFPFHVRVFFRSQTRKVKSSTETQKEIFVFLVRKGFVFLFPSKLKSLQRHFTPNFTSRELSWGETESGLDEVDSRGDTGPG